MSASEVIARAAAEVGYREGRNADGHWNNIQKYSPAVPGLEWSQGDPWCATFVCWCFQEAGAAGLIPVTAWVPTFRTWAVDHRQWSEYPSVGAVVVFGNPGSHTGIVESFTATTVTTIEGNTNTSGSAEGDGVYRRTRRRTDPYVSGYLVPAFSEGDNDVSAEEVWKYGAVDNRGTTDPADDQKVTALDIIRRGTSLAYQNRADIKAIRAEVDKIKALLGAPSGPPVLTASDLLAIAKAVIAEMKKEGN